LKLSVFSLRLLLWDCDDRTYTYYIEVSNDQKNWTRVVDKTQEPCKYVHARVTSHTYALYLTCLKLSILVGGKKTDVVNSKTSRVGIMNNFFSTKINPNSYSVLVSPFSS
jgi:hypothetical protein